MPTLAIVLATWNGTEHLPALLASLASQTRLPDEMVVGDDGSTDGSLDLVARWASQAPFPVRFLVPTPDRLGPARNFARLLAASAADVVLPCDQDDVWHADKTAICARLPADRVPRLLVHDLRVTDSHDRLIHGSFWRHQGFHPVAGKELRTLLAMNSFPGCAMAANRALLEHALPIPQTAVMHDWWLALVAAAVGRIEHDDRALIDYRQHGGNVLGARDDSLPSRLLRWFKPWRPEFRRSLDASQRQARALTLRFRQAVPRSARLWSVACRLGPVRRRIALIRSGIRKTGILRHLGMIARA